MLQLCEELHANMSIGAFDFCKRHRHPTAYRRLSN